MKIFVNKDIKNLFLALSAVWAGAFFLLQGFLWFCYGRVSLCLLLLFLLAGGTAWVVCYSYFKKQNQIMEQAVSQAKDAFGMYGKKTILFIDEIHRFNKAQQDYLLPFVEDGTVILIGATTENPYFEVNSALLSRSQIFHLEPLAESDIYRLVKTAVEDNERGMGAYGAVITEEAARFIAEMAGGDARRALNAVELGVLTTEPDDKGQLVIDLSVAEECIQRKSVNYDRDGDNHYDNISAFIKSMRGTDPDAAVFYLARMLDAGEDPKFIARRIMICASEDVGNADPQALVVAVAASQGVERIGMPEARILLSQAAAYVASAPKSNACIMAVDKALEMVRSQNTVRFHRI